MLVLSCSTGKDGKGGTILTTLADEAMAAIEDLRNHVETLESHVARLEGIIHVLLEETIAGRLEESAPEMLRAMPRVQSD